MTKKLIFQLAIFTLAMTVFGLATPSSFGKERAFAANLAPSKNPPVAVDDEYSADEDNPLEVAVPGVLANDSDLDGDTLIAILVLGPKFGALTLNADGSFVYTPRANFNGPDYFVYKANDGLTDSNLAIVNIDVQPVNDPPEAADDVWSVPEDTASSIHVLDNDTDIDGNLDPATMTPVSQPEHGSARTEAMSGEIVYHPTENYNGADSFTYQVCDTDLACDTAWVNITVTPINDPPIAQADEYQVASGEMLVITTSGVLENDSDVDNSVLTAALDGVPVHASHFDLSADGAFTYTAPLDFAGLDDFTYHAHDGQLSSDPATAEINVYDATSPSIGWVAPVADGEVFDVEDGSLVILQVDADDNIGISLVQFFRWDAIDLSLVDIGFTTQPPYQWELDVSELNPEWNQVFAVTYDTSGNESSIEWIWLYKLPPDYWLFLPMLTR